ncbi:MAG: pseudouridine synthase [Planctomycetota bacterium]|jgi:23S rRNA pseudouridine2605 synthase
MDRLHKVLAHAGIASRRACETLILEGRVSVDGEVVTRLGTQVDAQTQTIKVDGERIKVRARETYVLYKPKGVESTAGEESPGVKRAVDFAPRGAGRVYPVGRLDKESEGLLLLSSDGDLTEFLTHPRHHLPKVYHVVVRGVVPEGVLKEVREGVWLSDGKARLGAVKILQHHKKMGTLLEVTLFEGKNRQIRRVLAKVELKVKRLMRVSMGPIKLGDMKPGEVRRLLPDELAAIQSARENVPPRAGAARKGKSRGKRSGVAKAKRSARRASAKKSAQPKKKRAAVPKTFVAKKNAARKRPPKQKRVRDESLIVKRRPGAKPRDDRDDDDVIVIRGNK